MNVMGFAALSATGPLERFAFGRRAPRPMTSSLISFTAVSATLICILPVTTAALLLIQSCPATRSSVVYARSARQSPALSGAIWLVLVAWSILASTASLVSKGGNRTALKVRPSPITVLIGGMAVSPMVAIQMSLSCVISSCCCCLMVSIQPEPRCCFARASRHGRRCVAGMSAKTARLRWSVLAASDTWP